VQSPLSVPVSEYQARIEKVRSFAEEKGFSAVIAYSGPKIHMWYQTGHVAYLSGWSKLDLQTDTMVLVPTKGDPVLMCPGVTYTLEWIRRGSWMEDVRLVASPDPKAISSKYDDSVVAEGSGLMGRTFGHEIQHILAERGLKKKVGIAGIENMPVPIYRDLAVHLGEDNLDESDDIVARLRFVKSKAEIEIIQDVVDLSDAVFNTIPSVIKPGMFGYELQAELEHFARARGAEFAVYTLASSPADDAARGILDIGPHYRKLEWGDQIMVNTYLMKHGYFIQPLRSGSIGPASKQLKEYLGICVDIQHEIIESMRPGVPIKEVTRVARAGLQKRGIEGDWGRFGHGQGLDYGEWPYFTDTNPTLLEPGVVAIIHPIFTVPQSNSNFLYHPIGDVVLVTENGAKRLNRASQALFCAGV
jgi:Xaa-Pro aminopeptidase